MRISTQARLRTCCANENCVRVATVCSRADCFADLRPGVRVEEHLPEDGIVERMRAFYVAERETKAPALAAAKPLGELAVG